MSKFEIFKFREAAFGFWDDVVEGNRVPRHHAVADPAPASLLFEKQLEFLLAVIDARHSPPLIHGATRAANHTIALADRIKWRASAVLIHRVKACLKSPHSYLQRRQIIAC